MSRTGILAGLSLTLFAAQAGGEEAATLAEFSRTGDLICDMRISGSPAPVGRPRSDLMLIVDEVGAKQGAARVVSSRTVGGREVRVYSGETGVHLVEDVNDSVKVTTLLGCELRARGGRCLRYAAVMAWHFDRGVHLNADAAFRRLPGTSYAGTCEAWRMDGIRSAER
ncbi:MAG: hypothetical protein ACKVQK_14675 [Burkholderiales bacterium]